MASCFAWTSERGQSGGVGKGHHHVVYVPGTQFLKEKRAYTRETVFCYVGISEPSQSGDAYKWSHHQTTLGMQFKPDHWLFLFRSCVAETSEPSRSGDYQPWTPSTYTWKCHYFSINNNFRCFVLSGVDTPSRNIKNTWIVTPLGLQRGTVGMAATAKILRARGWYRVGVRVLPCKAKGVVRHRHGGKQHYHDSSRTSGRPRRS